MVLILLSPSHEKQETNGPPHSHSRYEHLDASSIRQ